MFADLGAYLLAASQVKLQTLPLWIDMSLNISFWDREIGWEHLATLTRSSGGKLLSVSLSVSLISRFPILLWCSVLPGIVWNDDRI